MRDSHIYTEGELARERAGRRVRTLWQRIRVPLALLVVLVVGASMFMMSNDLVAITLQTVQDRVVKVMVIPAAVTMALVLVYWYFHRKVEGFFLTLFLGLPLAMLAALSTWSVLVVGNYLLADDSTSRQRMATVATHYTDTSSKGKVAWHISLVFNDDGTVVQFTSSSTPQPYYDSCGKGDLVRVTVVKGGFGYEIIRDVEVVARMKPSTHSPAVATDQTSNK